MTQDRKTSIAVSAICHAILLFGISVQLTTPKEKQYVEVSLEEGLSNQDSGPGQTATAAVEGTQPLTRTEVPPEQRTKSEPPKLEDLKKPEDKEPEPVVTPKPDDVVLPTPVTPTRPKTPQAPTKQVATPNAAPSVVPSPAGEVNGGGSVGNNGKAKGSGKAYHEVKQATWKRRITPEYPQLAIRRRQEGVALLTLYISETGKLEKAEIKASSGVDLLDEAALLAAKHSTFYPQIIDGKPTACKAEAPYNFSLKDVGGN